MDEVECVIPDFTGCARGKIMPAAKFILEQGTRLPESVFVQGVTGDYIADDIYAILASPADGDILLNLTPMPSFRAPGHRPHGDDYP